ncbi:MAG TPA: hypothetical protein VGM86_23900, partial [Thermoanaerobaculia bacterium]
MFRRLLFVTLLCGATLIASSAAQEKKPAQPASSPAAVCQPRPGKNACDTCQENQCCVERRACEADAACAAFLNCLKTSCPNPPCNGHCGLPPPAYVARFVCQMEKCNTAVCGGPLDRCTFCTSTRCAKEVLSCLNQPGCDSYTQCAANCGKDSTCQARCQKPSA